MQFDPVTGQVNNLLARGCHSLNVPLALIGRLTDRDALLPYPFALSHTTFNKRMFRLHVRMCRYSTVSQTRSVSRPAGSWMIDRALEGPEGGRRGRL